jgi:hypothetical protein
MGENKQEILERVLLLMKYDNKKTLSENVGTLILEQYNVNTLIDEINKYDWRDPKRVPNIDDKIYQFAQLINTMSLPQLYKLRRDKLLNRSVALMGSKSYTPASLILDKTIYQKELKDFNDKKSKGITTTKNEFGIDVRLKQPEDIPSNLVSANYFRFLEPASRIIKGYENSKKIDTQQSLEKNQKCEKSKGFNLMGSVGKNPFKDKTGENGSDSFRQWFRVNYPSVAKTYNLSQTGPMWNQNMSLAVNHNTKCGWGIVFNRWNYDISFGNLSTASKNVDKFTFEGTPTEYDKVTRLKIKEPSGDFPPVSYKDAKNLKWDINNESVQMSIREWNLMNGFDEFYGIEQFKPKDIESGEGKKISDNLFKIDITQSPDVTNTKYSNINFDSISKASENLKWIEKVKKELKMSSFVTNAFTDEEIDRAINEKGMRAIEFLLDVADGKIRYKGHTLGGRYRDKDGSVKIQKGVYDTIPEDTTFWDEYGALIQIGGIILATIVSGGAAAVLGGSALSVTLAATAADVGINLVSANQNYKAGKYDEAKLDVAIAFLGVFAELPVISKFLTGGIDDWTRKSFTQKMREANLSSYQDLVNFNSNLTTTEQKLFQELLSNSEFQQQLSTFARGKMQQALAKDIGSAKTNLIKSMLREAGTKGILTLSPMIGYYGFKLIATISDLHKKIYGREITETEFERWNSWVKKNRSGVDYDVVADEIMNNPSLYQEALGTVTKQEREKFGKYETIDPKTGQKVNLQSYCVKLKEKIDKLNQEYEEQEKLLDEISDIPVD